MFYSYLQGWLLVFSLFDANFLFFSIYHRSQTLAYLSWRSETMFPQMTQVLSAHSSMESCDVHSNWFHYCSIPSMWVSEPINLNNKQRSTLWTSSPAVSIHIYRDGSYLEYLRCQISHSCYSLYPEVTYLISQDIASIAISNHIYA